MSAESKPFSPPATTDSSPAPSAFARLFWTLLGPMLLFGTIIHNAVSPRGWLSVWDAAVGLVVAAMLACRWREQRSGAATTAYGELSTPEHFRRYVVALIVVAGLAWFLANLLGNHVLS